jgi:hypothetical protein
MAWTGSNRFRSVSLRCSASLVAGLVLLTGCGNPDQQLLSDGARAARDAASEVATARITAQTLLARKVWSRAADQVVTDAETALGKVATTFDEQQPETARSRRSYDTISDALSQAESAVTATRIAIRAGDETALARQVPVLDRTAEHLRELGELAR